MPVWRRLLFKMADLVLYSPPEATFWPSSMHEYFVVGFFSNPTQALVARGDTQCSRTGKDDVFPATGESRGCKECSDPYSVPTKECGLHVRSFGMGIASQITLIRRHIIMG